MRAGGYPEQLCHSCGRPGHKKHECPSNVFGNALMGMSSFGGGNTARRDGDWDCMSYAIFPPGFDGVRSKTLSTMFVRFVAHFPAVDSCYAVRLLPSQMSQS
jgi:hypothetical protein